MLKSEATYQARVRAENKARLAIVTALLSKGASPKEVGALGRTPLIELSASGYSVADDTRLATQFLDLGTLVNAQDDFESTALMLAAQQGKLELVKLLLNRGADKNKKNCHGETALSLARFANHQKVVSLLE